MYSYISYIHFKFFMLYNGSVGDLVLDGLKHQERLLHETTLILAFELCRYARYAICSTTAICDAENDRVDSKSQFEDNPINTTEMVILSCPILQSKSSDGKL
jgi:hypothetical protein